MIKVEHARYITMELTSSASTKRILMIRADPNGERILLTQSTTATSSTRPDLDMVLALVFKLER